MPLDVDGWHAVFKETGHRYILVPTAKLAVINPRGVDDWLEAVRDAEAHIRRHIRRHLQLV